MESLAAHTHPQNTQVPPQDTELACVTGALGVQIVESRRNMVFPRFPCLHFENSLPTSRVPSERLEPDTVWHEILREFIFADWRFLVFCGN